MVNKHAIWLALGLACCGCSTGTAPTPSAPESSRPPVATDPLAKYRLVESPDHRDVAEKAISLANSMLGDEVPFRLQPSWKLSAKTAAPMVLVYLFEIDPPTKRSISFVPDKERCILVNASKIPFLNDLFANKSSKAVRQDPAHLLAITLLHESGHLFCGHSGSAEAADELNAVANVTETQDKEREREADAFVARQIRAAKADTKNAIRSIRAMNLAITLTMVSWNLGAQRILDDFGSGVLGSRRSFWDAGSSHPNFALRILTINQQMDPTPANTKLLDDFLQMRKQTR